MILFKFIDDDTETITQVDLSEFSSYSMSPFLVGGHFINLHHAVAATCEKGDMMIDVYLSWCGDFPAMHAWLGAVRAWTLERYKPNMTGLQCYHDTCTVWQVRSRIKLNGTKATLLT